VTWEHIGIIALAGFLGGAVNAAAGGGTLITFPALIAVGINPLVANVSSSVGLLFGYVGGSVTYRRELSEQKQRLKSFLVVAILGGVCGAAILLLTPPDAFEVLVPYLVILSALVLAAQPLLGSRLRRQRQERDEGLTDPSSGLRKGELAEEKPGWGALAGVFAASIYGSYFGAGLGVLLLAVLGIFLHDSLQRLNALKGLLSLLVNLVGVLIFVFSGIVDWLVVLILVPAAFLGGTLGARVARMLHPLGLRYTIVTLAVAVGVTMLVT
jgi:uncharacterized membrane protein YfcA